MDIILLVILSMLLGANITILAITDIEYKGLNIIAVVALTLATILNVIKFI